MSSYGLSNKPVLRRPIESGLRTAIRVVHDIVIGISSGERHHQRVDDQVGGLAFAH